MKNIAVIIVDIYDKTPFPEFDKRIDHLCIDINNFAKSFRNRGGIIIHAPSGLINKNNFPPSMFDRSCVKNIHEYKIESQEQKQKKRHIPKLSFNLGTEFIATKQNNFIEIDYNNDYLGWDGCTIYNLLKHKGIDTLYYVGGAINVCILWSRSFSILNMQNNDINIKLVADLSIEWYDKEYIDKKGIKIEWVKPMLLCLYNMYFCETIESRDILMEKLFKGPAWTVRQEKIIQAIIDCYGYAFFQGKTILSLGCGYGDIELKFLEYGAKLILSDARQEYLDYIQENNKHENITTFLIDIDSDWWIEEKVDIIFCIGLLYHTERPDKVLAKICNCGAQYLFLETEYVDTNDAYTVTCLLDAKENSCNHSIHNIGCRPSYGMILRVLNENNMDFSPITTGKYNSIYHNYDTGILNTNKIDPKSFRGMWACKKNDLIT